jgi:proteasome lid subunit RPN8/RPN11
MRAFRGGNLNASPTRFLLDPRDHLAAIREARASGHRVVGVYHSHPDGSSKPSRTDIAEASYSEYVYAIVVLTFDVAAVRFFCFETGNFLELPFVTVP